jgi:hypothetical protein
LFVFVVASSIVENGQSQNRIFGLLLHIKQIMDDFKLAKIKNMRESREFLLMKEIYRNIIMRLPNVIY